jgi:hypothetical protein
MAEEDWDISEWERFERDVEIVNNEVALMNEKKLRDDEEFNSVNELFSKPAISDNTKKNLNKLNPVKPATGNPRLSRPVTGRNVKPIQSQPVKTVNKPKKNVHKNIDNPYLSDDVDEELDYCCEITDKILNRCK